ncbi:ABC transporter ATP-binding protein [Mucilaginibacter sp. UYCu711]|uniref:ABC transporter ATP-binding protein n=1 Tax=Mucilaginibacter sp. UYCu711 TaxID=3156339 RepID=UPI003D1D8BCD
MKGINITGLSFTYNSRIKIFENFGWQLTLSPGSGNVTAIMGPSGAGKSTLLKLLLGIEKPQTGTIVMQPANPVIAYVPQEPVLFEHLSVKDNARYFSFAGAYKNRFDEKLYKELIISLDLEEVIVRTKNVTVLSGGQKQRLSLLRALSIKPDFLLLDEPCNGLDAEVKRSFLNKLREITIKLNLAVLYITHHKLEAQLIADDIVYLTPNKIKDCITEPIIGSIQQFLQAPPILEAANVFRFPDVKILPVTKDENGNTKIAKFKDATQYWLIEENNILITSSEGWEFRVASLSPIFGVLKHDSSETEWLVPFALVSGLVLDEVIKISIKGQYNIYDHQGLLISK